MMATIVTAAQPIRRGEFCVEVADGQYRPEPGLEGEGGIARAGYSTWPPEPIAAGEKFELMTDGGAQALVGDKPLWLEVRGGRVRFDLLPEGHLAELRQAMRVAGVDPPQTVGAT